MRKVYSQLLAIALVASLYLPTKAHSADLELSTGVTVNHLKDGYTAKDGTFRRYNENNDLFVISYKDDTIRYSVANFTNSYYKQSWLLSVSKTVYERQYFEVDLEIGAATNYGDEDTKAKIGDTILYFAPRANFILYQSKGMKIKASATVFGGALVTSTTVSFKF